MKINTRLTAKALLPKTDRVFELAGRKIRALDAAWDPAKGTPVFTWKGQYTSRGWTEWTQGFQFGMAFLHFDATGDEELLRLGREKTVRHMASHVSHVGVHDHGFNNVSTYGNLRRLILEGRLRHDGSNALAEHVGRAVAVKTQNSTVLSSQKSPGPIELARCMVWAAAIAARPTQKVKPAFAFH